MRKVLLIILGLLFTIACCKGQSDLRIYELIKKLSWNSISFRTSYRAFFPVDDEWSHELLKIGEPAAEALLKSIEDPNKTIIIHIILTRLYEPDHDFLLAILTHHYCSYIYINPKQDRVSYFIYNGLVWERSMGYDSIQKEQIEKIRLMWDLRIHGNSDPFDLNTDSLIAEVRHLDAEKNNCFDSKIFENNSSEVHISELSNLVGTKYPSLLFDIVLRKLGNDSTCGGSGKFFSNISFISYPTDGINFEFDNDNNLRTIFLNPIYKGTLYNGLKMSDTKEEIIIKLGQPEQFVNKPRYKYDWIYKRYNMLIAFGRTNRVIDLQINNGTNP